VTRAWCFSVFDFRVICDQQTIRRQLANLFRPWQLRLRIYWATVCKTVGPVLSDRCRVCLSVTLGHCGQTVGWIKMKLGMQVGLGPGDIVLLETQLRLKGHISPLFSAHVCCAKRSPISLLSSTCTCLSLINLNVYI